MSFPYQFFIIADEKSYLEIIMVVLEVGKNMAYVTLVIVIMIYGMMLVLEIIQEISHLNQSISMTYGAIIMSYGVGYEDL